MGLDKTLKISFMQVIDDTEILIIINEIKAFLLDIEYDYSLLINDKLDNFSIICNYIYNTNTEYNYDIDIDEVRKDIEYICNRYNFPAQLSRTWEDKMSADYRII